MRLSTTIIWLLADSMATSQAEPFYRIESTHEEVIFQKLAMTYASARQEIVSSAPTLQEEVAGGICHGQAESLVGSAIAVSGAGP